MMAIDADITEITCSIWESLFELPLVEGTTPPQATESTVTCCVHIEGAWNGALTFQCSMVLAGILTAEMFQNGSPPRVEDISDAVGELTNMLAGNVKALLPEPCHITLPGVAFGSDYRFSVVGTNPVESVAFSCGGHPLLVTLLRRTDDESTVTS